MTRPPASHVSPPKRRTAFESTFASDLEIANGRTVRVSLLNASALASFTSSAFARSSPVQSFRYGSVSKRKRASTPRAARRPTNSLNPPDGLNPAGGSTLIAASSPARSSSKNTYRMDTATSASPSGTWSVSENETEPLTFNESAATRVSFQSG